MWDCVHVSVAFCFLSFLLFFFPSNTCLFQKIVMQNTEFNCCGLREKFLEFQKKSKSTTAHNVKPKILCGTLCWVFVVLMCMCVCQKMTRLLAKLELRTAASALLGLISKVQSHAGAWGFQLFEQRFTPHLHGKTIESGIYEDQMAKIGSTSLSKRFSA